MANSAKAVPGVDPGGGNRWFVSLDTLAKSHLYLSWQGALEKSTHACLPNCVVVE
jgi:hypothetical protein